MGSLSRKMSQLGDSVMSQINSTKATRKFEIYFYAILTISALGKLNLIGNIFFKFFIAFARSSVLSKYLLFLPILYFMLFYPLGKYHLHQIAASFKINSALLLACSIVNECVHFYYGDRFTERLVLNIFILITSMVIFFDSNSRTSSKIAAKDFLESEQPDKTEIQEQYHHTDNGMTTTLLFAMIVGVRLSPQIFLAQAFCIYLDYFVIRRVKALKRAKFLIRGLQALILLVALVKQLHVPIKVEKESYWSSVIVKATALIFTALFTIQWDILSTLEDRTLIIFPEIKNCYPARLSTEKSIEYIKKHQHLFFLAAWGWSLLVPFPALLSSWSSVAYLQPDLILMFGVQSVQLPVIFYLLSVGLMSVIMLKRAFSSASRYASHILAELVVFLVWIQHLSLQKDEFSLLFYSFLCLGSLFVLFRIAKIYKIADFVNRKDVPFAAGRLQLEGATGKLLNPVIEAWIRTSSFSTALVIFIISAIYNPHYWYTLAIAFWIGMFPETKANYPYFLVSFTTLITTTIQLMGDQANGKLETFTETTLANIAVLVLSEVQRLRHAGGLYPVKEELLDEENPEVSQSFLVKMLQNAVKSLGSFSTFLLMGLLLFTPQIAKVTIQTSIYTLWTGVFVYLFYRPERTAKLRILAIRILALISAVFFLYSWTKAATYSLSNWRSPSRIYLAIHAAVFWLSCASFYGYRLQHDQSDEESKSPQTSPTINSSEEAAPSEFRHLIERLFVLFWTRIGAFLAFVSAFLNPCLLGVGHMMIGCSLVGLSVLSPQLYVPMIIWLEVSIFAPAIAFQLFDSFKDSNEKMKPLLPIIHFVVGRHDSLSNTVCLTAWALILFLQPIFIKLLQKHASEDERSNYLVSFRLLPEDNGASALQTGSIESFENSFRYYFSNWFIEFHDEIMTAALVTASIGRKGFLGLFYTCLAIIQICSKGAAYVKIIALVSSVSQIIVLLTRYIFSNCNISEAFKLNLNLSKKWKLFFLESQSPVEESDKSLMWHGAWAALFIFLTIRWYLTRKYCYGTEIVRRFDTHWCRFCGGVNKKAHHGYSRIKHSIHLYLGFASYLSLFFTSVLAFDYPTVPAGVLLLFSLVYFFYGETALLSNVLRSQVSSAVFVIFVWALLRPLYIFASIILDLPMTDGSYFDYLGLSINNAFESQWAQISLGLSVFLLLLQTRLYTSKAFPFLIARLYNSIINSSKRSTLFYANLTAIINFQQKNLKRAMDHVRAQLAVFRDIDISEWRKLCYVAPQITEVNAVEDVEILPEFGQEVMADEDEDSGDEGGPKVRRRNNGGYRDHLSQMDAQVLSDGEVEDVNALPSLSNMSNDSETAAKGEKEDRHADLELEKNFYFYTLIFCCKLIVQFLLSFAADYRRILQRPSTKQTMRMIFRGRSWIYRTKCVIELVLDLFHANFDIFLDILVMDAHMYHSSGFSTVLACSVLLAAHLQRPFTGKKLNNFMMVATSIWIFFSYMTLMLKRNNFLLPYMDSVKAGKLSELTESVSRQLEVFSKLFWTRLFGLHHLSEMVDFIRRPAILLLALSYKRSIMRHLGLWQYNTGIRMARAYCQSEDDLTEDDLSQLEVNDEDAFDEEEHADQISTATVESDLESADEGIIGSDTLSDAEFKEELKPKSLWEILKPRILMPWRDYYALMFAADFACMLIAFYYWGDFMLGPTSHNGDKNRNDRILMDMINHNLIPRSLVNMLVFNTFMLLVDRALYVGKNYMGKLIMQVTTVVLFHWYIFFYLPFHYPVSKGTEMYSLFGVRLWYAFKWVYWVASGLQLRYSYPPLRTETFLSSSYNIFASNLRMMFKYIPFIEELRTIVDWSMTPSALGVWAWLKLADISDRFHAVQCGRAFQGSYYGRHSFGQKFHQFSKYVQGVVFLVIFVLILWSPFLVFSNPSVSEPNDVESITLSFAIKGFGVAFASFMTTEISAVNDEEFENLKTAEGVNAIEMDKTFFSSAKFPFYSQTEQWTSSLNKDILLRALADTANPMSLVVSWSVHRKAFQDVQTVYGSTETVLDKRSRSILEKMLFGCHYKRDELDHEDADNEMSIISLDLKDLIPQLVDAPLNNSSRQMIRMRKAILMKHCPKRKKHGTTNKETKRDSPQNSGFKKGNGKKGNLWKKVQGNLGKVIESDLEEIAMNDKLSRDHEYFAISVGKFNLNMFIYSAKRPVYNFSSFNLIGLYATGVFAVAQLLRLMHADMTTRIPLDELPNPMPLLNMCRQILMVREMGDYESEEAIYWQLIEILRNPKILIEMTKLN